MTDYINGGVQRTKEGTLINHKRTLIALVKEDPHLVTFFPTALDGAHFDGPLNKLPIGPKLSVAGPDPHHSRHWYATIERLPNDRVRVT